MSTEIVERYGLKDNYKAAAITLTNWFHLLLGTLIETREFEYWNKPCRWDMGDWKGNPGDPLPDEEEYDEIEDYIYEPFFESLLPLFTEGELTQTLPRKIRAFKDGIFQLKVSLPSAWRQIQVTSQHTLEDLHLVIQKAFHFDDDHLYGQGMPFIVRSVMRGHSRMRQGLENLIGILVKKSFISLTIWRSGCLKLNWKHSKRGKLA